MPVVIGTLSVIHTTGWAGDLGCGASPSRGIAPLRQSAGSSASTVQTGNMLYKINLAHGLHDKEHRQGGSLPMPWERTSVMDQRVQFIADWLSGEYFNNGSDPPPARPPGVATLIATII